MPESLCFLAIERQLSPLPSRRRACAWRMASGLLAFVELKEAAETTICVNS
jgi:hypothetical protein